MKKFGIVYHPLNEGALALAGMIESFLISRGLSVWLCSAWEGDCLKQNLPHMDCAITVGGDGTILRTAQAIVPHAIPIIGVNLGKIGFLTEIAPDTAVEKIARLLDGGGWMDERIMLEAELFDECNSEIRSFNVLNDIVIARGEIARIINVTADIDRELLTTYKSDGVICATATGSTGYSMATGGPILNPQSADYLLSPIMAHMSFDKILVIPVSSVVRLQVAAIHKAVLSVDGHISLPVDGGYSVEVKHSDVRTCFWRLKPKEFYGTLEKKLKR
ncbi:MAG: NAD(+)/NADH kinase [Dehalococcoidales bacterium]|nr:NAD(+)/NADH kinase [Dehalococcoidales bacterium]